ncbi:MAG: hypothetical protein H6Q69_3101 [Firmicutes bacterium]|nr:hypothetical protein [Bacillota bacterium]
MSSICAEKKGVIIGVSTSRSKKNILAYLDDLNP